MMKKMLFVLPFIALAIAFSGCKPAEDGGNVTRPAGVAYVGGDKGLEPSFLANAPPSVVYDNPEENADTGNPFDISVKIENKGEYTVPKDKYKLTISGIDPGAFSKTTDDFKDLKSTEGTTSEELLKTRRSAGEVIPGTFTMITISGLKYKSPVSGQIGPFNLRASICYEYQTEASSNICILEDLLGTIRREGICKPTETKATENSGGPLLVSNLEQSVTGKDRTAFTFTIKHIGGDKNFVFKNEDQSCAIGDRTKQDKVGVKIELGEKDITKKCSGVDITTELATLYGDAGATIRCPISLTELELTKGDYVQPVKITLIYDYYQYVDEELTVRQVGT